MRLTKRRSYRNRTFQCDPSIIRFTNDAVAVAKVIKQEKPDIILLQTS
jgi:hypothetical protein